MYAAIPLTLNGFTRRVPNLAGRQRNASSRRNLAHPNTIAAVAEVRQQECCGIPVFEKRKGKGARPVLASRLHFNTDSFFAPRPAGHTSIATAARSDPTRTVRRSGMKRGEAIEQNIHAYVCIPCRLPPTDHEVCGKQARERTGSGCA
jgi:hypothetical protein